jgi:AcrR family transcriptional regulator
MLVQNQMESPFDARRFTSHSWLRFGDDDAPTLRQKLVFLALEELITVGFADIDIKRICTRMGENSAIIAQYFGGVDGLLAEAIVVLYRKSCRDLRARLRAAPPEPEQRIRTWVEGDVEFSKRMGGFSILLSFPMVSRGVHKVLREKFSEDVQKYSEFYAALVATLVADLRYGTVSDFDFDADSAPAAELMRRPYIAVATASIMWSTLGLTTWANGSHYPSVHCGGTSFSEVYAIRTHISHIIEVARGDVPSPHLSEPG